VVEDVTDVILNLKEVRFRVSGDELFAGSTLRSRVKAELQPATSRPAMVEVLNPDQHICTLAKDPSLEWNSP